MTRSAQCVGESEGSGSVPFEPASSRRRTSFKQSPVKGASLLPKISPSRTGANRCPSDLAMPAALPALLSATSLLYQLASWVFLRVIPARAGTTVLPTLYAIYFGLWVSSELERVRVRKRKREVFRGGATSKNGLGPLDTVGLHLVLMPSSWHCKGSDIQSVWLRRPMSRPLESSPQATSISSRSDSTPTSSPPMESAPRADHLHR